MSHRFEIFNDTYEYVQKLKQENLAKQREYVEKIGEKGEHIIKFRKMPKEANSDLKKIQAATHIRKIDKQLKDNIKE
jgi:hypothetical protein